MGVRLHKEPKLKKPDMIVGWPGIGNIGIITADAIREQVEAKEFGEIEPYDFFYPSRVTITADLLTDIEFPHSKFYYQRLENKDLIIFIGEEQPADGGRMYAEGKKAYQLANLVLDLAEKFDCQRVYTSGAAVSLVHHRAKPRVWIAPNRHELIGELRKIDNTVLMSEVEGGGGQGSITGLNGLLLGVAQKRGIPGACLMGEIPDYISGAPFPYPKASKSVLEVMSRILGIPLDTHKLDEMDARIFEVIENIYEQLPQDIKERIEQRAVVVGMGGVITEDDQRWIKDHIDEFFRKGGKGNAAA